MRSNNKTKKYILVAIVCAGLFCAHAASAQLNTIITPHLFNFNAFFGDPRGDGAAGYGTGYNSSYNSSGPTSTDTSQYQQNGPDGSDISSGPTQDTGPEATDTSPYTSNIAGPTAVDTSPYTTNIKGPTKDAGPTLITGDPYTPIGPTQSGGVLGQPQTVTTTQYMATAQTCTALDGTNPTIKGYVAFALCVINKFIIPILVTLAVVIFIWGVSNFVLNAGDEEAREKGKQFMIWGIIALFVIVSVWGIVKLLTTTFGFGSVIPQLK